MATAAGRGRRHWARFYAGNRTNRNDDFCVVISVCEQTLELEIGVLGSLNEFQTPSLDSIEQAELVVRNRTHFRGQRWNCITLLYPVMERVYIETLACALCMGIEWITQTSKSLKELVPVSLTSYPILENTAEVFDTAVTWLLTMSAEDLKIDQTSPGLLPPLLALTEDLVVVGFGMGTEMKENPKFWADQEPRILDNGYVGKWAVGVVWKN